MATFPNWVVTLLLIDHVYLNHLVAQITDKLILANLQHLTLCGFLGFFFCPITKQNVFPHHPFIQPTNGRLG